MRTYCSATGPRWAERTTVVSGAGGDLIQSTAIWVAVSAGDGRPVPLGESFQRVYGPSTEGRQVSARLSHPGPPESATGRPWPLRAADFDPAGHVNNSVHWAAVEDELARLDWLPGQAELEYQRPILPGAEPELVTSQEPANYGPGCGRGRSGWPPPGSPPRARADRRVRPGRSARTSPLIAHTRWNSRIRQGRTAASAVSRTSS